MGPRDQSGNVLSNKRSPVIVELIRADFQGIPSKVRASPTAQPPEVVPIRAPPLER